MDGNTIIMSILGFLALVLAKYGVDIAVRIVGSGKLSEFASRTLVTALRRGLETTQDGVEADGWQIKDALAGAQAMGKYVLKEAMSQKAVDMYLEELPNWLKRSAFGSQDNVTIKASPRNLEVIESQLTGAAATFLNQPLEVQRAFVSCADRQNESVAA